MQKVTMFTMAGCPYCRAAHRWMEELMQEYPEYNDIELEIIDETEHPDIADRYDYYSPPTTSAGTRSTRAWPQRKRSTACSSARCGAERSRPGGRNGKENPQWKRTSLPLGVFALAGDQARSSVACLTKAFSTSSRVEQ